LPGARELRRDRPQPIEVPMSMQIRFAGLMASLAAAGEHGIAVGNRAFAR